MDISTYLGLFPFCFCEQARFSTRHNIVADFDADQVNASPVASRLPEASKHEVFGNNTEIWKMADCNSRGNPHGQLAASDKLHPRVHPIPNNFCAYM
ncbi:hypothetical protein BD414DRAFT_81632 [Trametes punicea]|nr:hypothetical protein BD414DRAFT_81632 [Trametes punicea]